MLAALGLQGQFSGAQAPRGAGYCLPLVTEKSMSHGLYSGPLPAHPPWTPGEELTASHPPPRSLAAQPQCADPS